MASMNISLDWKAVIGIAAFLFLNEQFEKLWRRYRQSRAQIWPVTVGRVLEAAVFRGKHEVTLTLRYSYAIPDEPYPIPAEFQKQFLSPSEAELWADALSGQPIPVRVNPKNVWKSQLWDSELEAIVTSTAASAAQST